MAQRLEDWRKLEPSDPFVVQQLALATYRSESPDKISALEAAARVLETLQPTVSGDAETVARWGAIYRRLWDARRSRADLDEAIRAYGRGFQLANDYYNGINLAFVLEERANESTGDEAVADRVLAARARREALKICDHELDAAKKNPAALDPRELYWLHASRAEALFGLGRRDEADVELVKAMAAEPKPDDWMIERTKDQLKALGQLLARRYSPQ